MNWKTYKISRLIALLNKMIILGIDPGFGRLGYAAIEGEKNNARVLECECFETSSKIPHEKRIILVADKVKSLIKELRPEIIAIEKVFFSKNQKTAMQIAEIRGILLYLAASNNIPVKEFTPLEVKFSLCGYGKADKNQVRKMLKMILNLQFLPKSDDASDALAICLVCSSFLPLK